MKLFRRSNHFEKVILKNATTAISMCIYTFTHKDITISLRKKLQKNKAL